MQGLNMGVMSSLSEYNFIETYIFKNKKKIDANAAKMAALSIK